MEKIDIPSVRQYKRPFPSRTSSSRPSMIKGNRIIQSSHMIFQLYAAIYPDNA